MIHCTHAKKQNRQAGHVCKPIGIRFEQHNYYKFQTSSSFAQCASCQGGKKKKKSCRNNNYEVDKKIKKTKLNNRGPEKKAAKQFTQD